MGASGTSLSRNKDMAMMPDTNTTQYIVTFSIASKLLSQIANETNSFDGSKEKMLRIHFLYSQFYIYLGFANLSQPGTFFLEPLFEQPGFEQTLRVKSPIYTTLKSEQLWTVEKDIVTGVAAQIPAAASHLWPINMPHAELAVVDPWYGRVRASHESRSGFPLIHLARTSANLPMFNQEIPYTKVFLEGSMDLDLGFIEGRIMWLHLPHPGISESYAKGVIPEVLVNSPAELMSLTSMLAEKVSIAKSLGYELWFRGQNRDYRIAARSSKLVADCLPYANIEQSSLLPLAYRSYDRCNGDLKGFLNLAASMLKYWSRKYLKVKPALVEQGRKGSEISLQSADGEATLQISMRPGDNGRIISVARTFEEGADGSQKLVGVRHWDPTEQTLRLSYMFQHYGLPTGYLDITRNPMVASFFALNSFRPETGGRFQYELAERDTIEPLIYCILTKVGRDDVVDSASAIEASSSTRIKRQQCGLLGDSGNLARNYASRNIALKIKLGKGFVVDSRINAEYLFPRPAQDPFLAAVMDSPGYEHESATEFLFEPTVLS
jgi:hypothetical protein